MFDDDDFDVFTSRIRGLAGDRPLENITAAVELSTELQNAGDRLVARFVEEARQSGLSWTQIGTSLGVTRQAAQHRYVQPSSFAPPSQEGMERMLRKRAPFSAVREFPGGVNVQVEIGGGWYELIALDGRPAGDLIAVCRAKYGKRWLKRLSEDLDDVYALLGAELGDTAEIAIEDARARVWQRTVEVTMAKRKAAWRFNNERTANS